ncbi:hypothetical protein N7493_008170 [Penicillium malachiteum]|uniref:Uncharacterized protein n=1 Tax=Penicillium malachiteum TaxID=1324776 RepID=A0AAD6MTG6_9EURO|nr:hypothetical protein N7493_008170 [Penicillium malachiteum]
MSENTFAKQTTSQAVKEPRPPIQNKRVANDPQIDDRVERHHRDPSEIAWIWEGHAPHQCAPPVNANSHWQSMLSPVGPDTPKRHGVR